MDAAKLIQLKKNVDDAYYPHPAPSLKRLLWFVVGFYPLLAVCHVITIIRRSKTTGGWLMKKDSQGYFHPNMNIVMPLLSLILTTTITVGTILLQYNFKSYIRPLPVIVEVMSFNLIHSLNWSRTFATVYAMPPASSHLSFFQDDRRSVFSKGSKIFSPLVYNFLHGLGYIWGLTSTVVYSALLSNRIKDINKNYQSFSTSLENIMSLQHTTSPDRSIKMAVLAHQAMHSAEQMKHSGHLVFKYIKSVIMVLLALNVISILLLVWATAVILRCLKQQVRIYEKYVVHREDAIQLGMISTHGEKPGMEKLESFINKPSLVHGGTETNTLASKQNSSGRFYSFYTRSSTNMTNEGSWRDWIPTLQRGTVVEQSLWSSNLMDRVNQPQQTGGALLKSQHQALKRYVTNTSWQTIMSLLLCFSYMSMGIALLINPFDVPVRRNYADLLVLIYEWTDLIWLCGGTVMAVLIMVVTLSPAPTFLRAHGGASELAAESTFVVEHRESIGGAPSRLDY